MSEHNEEREVDELSGTETTGHEWDGIKELDTPMPRWWVWTLLRHDHLFDRLLHLLSGDPADRDIDRRYFGDHGTWSARGDTGGRAPGPLRARRETEGDPAREGA